MPLILTTFDGATLEVVAPGPGMGHTEKALKITFPGTVEYQERTEIIHLTLSEIINLKHMLAH